MSRYHETLTWSAWWYFATGDLWSNGYNNKRHQHSNHAPCNLYAGDCEFQRKASIFVS